MIIVGLKIARLTAIEYLGSGRWRFSCDCGAEITTRGYAVYSGHTASCGCQRRDRAKAGSPRRSHDMRHHYLYRTWDGMMQRCLNPKNPSFHNYGGRGIKICDDWIDVRKFIEDVHSEIGERPIDTTLDRIDNDGNYEPGNIRWATKKQQSENRRIA